MADDPQLAAQMQALRSQIDALNGASGIGAASQLSQLTAQYNQLFAQQQQARKQQVQTNQQAQTDKAKADAEAARQKILGTAQGGIDRLNNDPTDQVFRQYLQQQMGQKTLDPNGKPFADGAPQYTAQGAQGQQGQASTYDANQMGAAQTQAFGYNPQQSQVGAMDAAEVNYQDPFNAQTVQAMVNEQASGAGAAESARNQLMRDALLANGGNAFDPSLQAAQAESMSERQKAVANARNQINIVANRENANTRNAAQLANAGFKQQAGQFNTGSANQNNQFNAGAVNQAGQYNASANQNAANQNAAFLQQANQFNAGALNQAGQYNAGAQQNASFQNAQMGQQNNQFNAGVQNQAGMFNVGNQMQAGQANFNAGTQAQMYNQGQQSQAAGQLGSYNNQRQGMISDAEGRLINLTGQQVFRGPETQLPQQQIQLPTFQQYSTQQQSGQRPVPQTSAGVTGTYQNPSIQAGSGSSVWAGSGKPSTGSGFTTSSFGPTGTGTPIYQQATQYVSKPAVNPYLAPQTKKPLGPNDNSAIW